MLIINNLKKYFHSKSGENLVIDNVSFKMNNFDFISIVGPSGCGKSTVLSMIAGVLEKSDGEIIKDCSTGYMFQNDLLFDWLTILDNCLLPLTIKNKVTKTEKEVVIKMLEKYGLGNCLNMFPHELSGGMRQRVV